MEFEWDGDKNSINLAKHGLSFYEAQSAFLDSDRIIYPDQKHSSSEDRYFCVGKTNTGSIATIRFTLRNNRIRIIGAGYWREGRRKYDK
ncbi:MAG TPA: BrnT family toxin [Candidatus Saccharimonadales bacterium]